MANLNVLRAIKLFSGLNEPELRQVAGIARQCSYSQGTRLFSEGEESLGLFCVISGRVRVFKASPSGKEHTLHEWGPGGTFAEVAAFSHAPYPANAEVLEDSELLFISSRDMRTLITREPDVAMAMMALFSRRLIEFTRKIELLTLKEIPARLAGHFLLLAGEEKSFMLDMPKGRLAVYLGAQPETVSRAQSKLAEAGLIRVEGRRYEILDTEGLQAVAAGMETV